jgi:hypothetical protein
MKNVVRSIVAVSCVFALGTGLAQAEPASKPAAPADAEKEAAMAAMMKLGSPSEGHKALEPLVGKWNYTMQMRMAPDAPPQTMSGTATNELLYGGRFLKQRVQGAATADFPAFEGTGITGYDNIRKEYQTVWFDSMASGIAMGTGQHDPAAKTLTFTGDFSCPMTGEAHRAFRDVWKIVDNDHLAFESYSKAPAGTEFKSMEIQYTRAQ